MKVREFKRICKNEHINEFNSSLYNLIKYNEVCDDIP